MRKKPFPLFNNIVNPNILNISFMLTFTQGLKKTMVASAMSIVCLAGLQAQLEVNSYYVSGNGVAEAVSSKSGTKYFTADNYSTIRVYDISSFDVIDQFESTISEVKCIDIDPTGNFLLMGGNNGGLSVYDINAKKEKLSLKTGSTDYFYCARYSADGKKIVAASLDTNVYVFNASTGSLEKKFRGPSDIWIWALTFDKTLSYFVAGGSDGKTEMFDAKGNFYKKINGFTSTIWSADAAPDGKEFVIGAWDNTLKVYEFGCGYMRLDIRNGDQWVYSVKWSPDGKYLLSGDAGGVLRLWNAKDGKLNSAYQAHSGTIEDIRFSPDMKYVITSGADGYMKVLNYDSLKTPTDDVYSYTEEYDYDDTNYDDYNYNPVYDGVTLYAAYSLYGYSGAIDDFDFNADGTKFATAEYNYLSAVYNTSDVSYVTGSSYQQNNILTSVAWDPKGNNIAYAGEETVITIYDSKTGTTVKTLRGHTASIYGLKWTSDGKIVSGATDNTVKVWDAKNGSEIKTLSGHSDWIWEVDVDPKNKTIISSASSGELFLWDIKSGKLKKKLEGMTGTIFDCGFSPDGKYIVAASWDGMVGMFDANGNSRWIANTTSNTWAYAVGISPDNKYVFAGDNYGNVFVYEASTGALKKTIFVSSTTINTIKVTKDKKYIAISDDGGVLNFFNYEDFVQ